MAFKGCTVYNTADVLSQNYTTATAIPFPNELYDTDSFHDAASNTSRLTVPSGVTRVILAANMRLGSFNSAEVMTVEIKKNGSSMTPPIIQKMGTSVANPAVDIRSPPLEVTAGDYFELVVQVPTDTNVIRDNTTWFSIWEHPDQLPTFNGVLVGKSAAQTAANYTALTTLAFDSENYDTNSWHDNASNNSRLTVPSGVNYAILNYGVRVSNMTANLWLYMVVIKNGAALTIPPQLTISSGQTTFAGGAMSYPIPVSPGDYIEVQLQVLSDTSITVETDVFASAYAVG